VTKRMALARVVDEELLAGAVVLPHDEVDLRLEAAIQLAELAVLVRPPLAPIGEHTVAVLGPHELQRHARLAHLLAHPLEVDRCTLRRLAAAHGREQLTLDRGVVELARPLPRHAGLVGAMQVVVDRPLRHPRRRGDAAVAQPAFVLEPEDFSDSSHSVALHAAR